MSDTSNLGERKRRRLDAFPDPVSESDTEDDDDFAISGERKRLDAFPDPVSESDSEDDEVLDRSKWGSLGRDIPVSKKMKKGTICQECKKDYGKNLGRHMKTHLPSDSPEKMKWLAHKQQYQGGWSRQKYGENEEHRLAKRAQSKRNNEIAKNRNGGEVVALQEFACCKILGSCAPSCSCRLDAQSQNDERASDCILL
jgi:hypothetical protein